MAWRLFRREPRSAVLAILTIAIGMASTTALFGITYGVLMKPLPWPNADRIVVLQETRGGRTPRFLSFTNAAYLAWQEQASTIENLAAWSTQAATLTGAGDAERVQVVAATPSLFDVLGVRPMAGTVFTGADVDGDAVVLSEGLWRERFGGERSAIGQVVHFDGVPRTVVGVLPAATAFPNREADAWIPFRVRPAAGNLLSMFNALATLRPGATAPQAAAEATARGRFVPDTGMTTVAIFGTSGPVEITATPIVDALTGEVRRALLLQLGAVGLLLVIAVTNVASLQLARATSRRREFAIRAALGATRARIARQLLVESAGLGLAGSAAGLAGAVVLHRALVRLLPADFPRGGELAFDGTVLLFAAALAALTTLTFGVLPAIRLRRTHLVQPLTEDGNAPVGVSTRTGAARARLAIVAGQVALSCVLLAGAVFLGRSFLGMLHADRGFNPREIVAGRVWFPASLYQPERRHALMREILSSLESSPVTREAAFTSEHPLSPGGSTASFQVPSRDAAAGLVSVQASPRIVSDRYFSTLGLRVLEGRSFDSSDGETSQRVAVVNETFARRYFSRGAVGERIPGSFWSSVDAQATIIGVVEDVRYIGAPREAQPEMFFPYRQLNGSLPVPTVTILIRQSDVSAASRDLRRAVRAADDTLSAEGVMTLEERLVMTILARPRLYASLLAVFAVVAMLVTAVGLFAVLSQSVTQRTRELGVRAALGATRGQLIRLVIQQSLVVTLAGLAVGVPASLWLAHLSASLLHGVSPVDGLTYIVVSVLVLISTISASAVPAHRAATLDPLRALRS